MGLEDGKDSLHWVVAIVLLASQFLVSEYSSRRGSPDFDDQMLRLSMR